MENRKRKKLATRASEVAMQVPSPTNKPGGSEEKEKKKKIIAPAVCFSEVALIVPGKILFCFCC